MKGITAGCCQFGIVPGEIDKNLAEVGNRLQHYGDLNCQLVVLPEMWPCSFVYPRLRSLASRSHEVVDRMKDWAMRHRMVLVGSLPEAEEGVIYNTSYVIDCNGEVAGKYRKIHLFGLLGEDQHFGRGDSPLVCSTAIGNIGVMICYDLRFPELARRLALEGAEVICVSALWPTARIEHWSILLRSRAIENQLFIVGCNGNGVEDKIEYGGASAIVSPLGTVLAEANGEEGTVSAPLDPEEMFAFRQRIPCFADRVPTVYGLGGRKGLKP